jgi:sucrose phosphorylase
MGLYGEAAPRLMERLGLLAARYPKAERDGKGLWDQTDVVLITYGDMIEGKAEHPLVNLNRFLERRLKSVFSIVHLLPFFPYSSDDGFSVIDYREVNPELGDWDDISLVNTDFDLMFDLVLNHVSSQSDWFRNYSSGVAPARDFFIEIEPGTDLGSVVRPRTSPLLTPVCTPYGERWLWTTFSADQVDLDFSNPDVLFEFLDILLFYVQHGARIIRMDAIAYLWKQLGTSCVNRPETHQIVKLMRDVLDMMAPGTLLLTETNLPHEQNISYFGKGDEAHMVYQFSLPPLLLHALLNGTTRYLKAWIEQLDQPPPGCTYFNFTASHDGIGVRPLEGLMPDTEIRKLVSQVRHRGGLVSSRAGADGEEVPYELNVTYFDAMGDSEGGASSKQVSRFLCSQALMISLRGIPGVYFHSLTATGNDYSGVERTGHARAINRHRWDEAEMNRLLGDAQTPNGQVFRAYLSMLRTRREHQAFHPDAPQRVLALDEGLFGLERQALDGSEQIFCLYSFLDRSVRVDVSDLGESGTAQPVTPLGWQELLKGKLPNEEGEMVLEPYECLWLMPVTHLSD